MCCSNKKYKIVMHYFVKCKSYNQANCLTIRAKCSDSECVTTKQQVGYAALMQMAKFCLHMMSHLCSWSAMFFIFLESFLSK